MLYTVTATGVQQAWQAQDVALGAVVIESTADPHPQIHSVMTKTIIAYNYLASHISSHLSHHTTLRLIIIIILYSHLIQNHCIKSSHTNISYSHLICLQLSHAIISYKHLIQPSHL